MWLLYVCCLLDGIAKTQATYGQGTGSIALTDVVCSGSEIQLLACSSSPIFDVGSCAHNEDAGVVCEGKLSFNYHE